MRVTKLTLIALVLSISLAGRTALAANKPPAPIDPAIAPVLDQYEKMAADGEASIAKFANSKDANVAMAYDAAYLRLDSMRRVRGMLQSNPDVFKWLTPVPKLMAEWQSGFEFARDCAAAGKDPYVGLFKGLRTVRSPIDGQQLLYHIQLPANYDASKTYPLYIDLHHATAILWHAAWVDARPSTEARYASNDGVIHIEPCGRGSNSFSGMGEAAVLDCMRDAMAHYSIDPDRVHVGGMSMGGAGGLRFGALYPDLFASCNALTAHPAYMLPVGNGMYDPTLSIENVAHLGTVVWCEPFDMKADRGVANQAWIDQLKSLESANAGEYPHKMYLDEKGTHGIIDKAMVAEGFKFLFSQVRDPLPKHVVYKTYTLRRNTAYWTRIDGMADAEQPAELEAHVDGNKIAIKTTNISGLTLTLPAKLVGGGGKASVSLDGGGAIDVAASDPAKPVQLVREGPAWKLGAADLKAGGLVKKHALSGPVLDVFMGEPVLIVYGTLGGHDKAAADPIIDKILEANFGPPDGLRLLRTGFDRRADKDLKPEDVAKYNLVLIGTPAQNSVVRDLADKLPVKFAADGLTIGGKTYSGPGVGIVMAYPNPLNSERYVLLMPENFGDNDAQAFTDVYNFPDYAVGRTKAGYGGNHFVIEGKGTFNSNWKLEK